MKKAAIVGNGRFGQVLLKLLKDDFSVSVFDSKNSKSEADLRNIYANEVVFFAVPISAFESVIKSHKKHFRKDHLLIDVLSVKMHPEKILRKHLKNTGVQAILTHPMFGPDSSKNGFIGLPIMINRFLADKNNFIFWKDFFIKKGLKVVEMTAEKHDRLAAESQGLTHFVGRILGELQFAPTSIDTLGAKKLHEVVEQTCNDNLELFMGLQNFNPFTKQMRIKLGKAYEKVYEKLLPKRVSKKHVIIGIQGGKGSFNEQAALFVAKKNKIKKFKMKYLYTTEKVLKNLRDGSIDYGIFAIENAVGGMVTESAHAMAKFKFEIVEEFAIEIRHFLMKRKDIDFKSITSIMAHPQVFLQCRATLPKKFPNLKQFSGKGDLIDNARAAWAVANGKVPKSTAVLGPKILAEIYGLDIVAENLQDSKNNLTTFFLVSR